MISKNSWKYRRYRLKWNMAKHFPPNDPLHIDVELTSVCNLRCTFCPQSDDKKKFRPGHMELGMFKMIVSEATAMKIDSIKLNLRGESTLHPEFAAMCAAVQGRFTDIRLNTNGNYKRKLNSVIAKTFTEVCFSIDALESDTYRQIRVGGNLNVVYNNIMELANLMDLKHQTLKLSFVKTKKNQHELKEFISFWKYKIPRIKFFIRDVAERTEESKADNTKPLSKKRKNCLMPIRRLTVTWDGNVHPCCVATWNNDLVLGNINSKSLKEIWTSRRIATLRKVLDSGAAYKMIGACSHCLSRESYQ